MTADISPLATRIAAGERVAISNALNWAEDRRPETASRTRALLQALRNSETAHRIGITGPPGVGKSTLAGAMANALLLQASVAVLAVDPSSPASGGAILGDRVRIPRQTGDGLFIRSVATDGRLGGLAWCVPASARILSVAFEFVLIETTGVGQTEVDIRHAVDTVVLLVQPGSGDSLQFVKAGIMEIPDIIVVHKADQAGAEAAAADLRGRTTVPVLLASGTTGEGVSALVEWLKRRPKRDRHTRATADAAWLASVFRAEYGNIAVRSLGGQKAVETLLRDESLADPVGTLGAYFLRSITRSQLTDEAPS